MKSLLSIILLISTLFSNGTAFQAILPFQFEVLFIVQCEVPFLVRQYDKISYIAVDLTSRNVTLKSTIATKLKGSFSLAVDLKSVKI